MMTTSFLTLHQMASSIQRKPSPMTRCSASLWNSVREQALWKISQLTVSGMAEHNTGSSMHQLGLQFKRLNVRVAQVDTLMKYLIDSLQSYEKSYCDMLCPTCLDTEQSFMGEHQLSRHITLGDMNLMGEALLNAIRAHSPHTAPSPECHHASEHAWVTVPHACETIELTMRAEPMRPTHCVSVIRTDPPQSNNNPNKDDVPALSSHVKKHPAPYPIAGVLIPNLRRGPQAWQQAVKQLEEGVPSQGVPPLKDWPSSWYTGRMCLIHGAKRGERETIAKEYERWSNSPLSMICKNSPPRHARYGRDNEAFLLAYPVAVKSVTALVDAICSKHGWRCCSKNGTYDECSSSSPSPSAWFKWYHWVSSQIQTSLSIHIYFEF